MGAGNAEAGVSAGVAYTPLPALASSTADTGFAALEVPVEGNLRYGLNDTVDLNFHISNEGITPGVKIGVTSGDWDFAVLPSIGVGLVQLTPVRLGGSRLADAVLRRQRGRAAAGLEQQGPVLLAGVSLSVREQHQRLDDGGLDGAVGAHGERVVRVELRQGPAAVSPRSSWHDRPRGSSSTIDDMGSSTTNSVLLTIMPMLTIALTSAPAAPHAEPAVEAAPVAPMPAAPPPAVLPQAVPPAAAPPPAAVPPPVVVPPPAAPPPVDPTTTTI